MKTLLHICCAPCSIMCIETLRSEGIEPVGFWFNPNIHPYTEYRSRRDALIQHAKDIEMELILAGDYGLREFIRNVSPDFDRRCGYCYSVRAEAAAAYAAEHGFDSFTSTLLISPYQNHELLRETMERSAEKYGVEFLYRDFRPYFREGQEKAREKDCTCKNTAAAFSARRTATVKNRRKRKRPCRRFESQRSNMNKK